MLRIYLKFFIFAIVFIGFSPSKAGVFDDFFVAIRNDDLPQVRQLLRRGVDPNWPDPTGDPALLVALKAEAKDVSLFLARQPQTQVQSRNPFGETPLMMAAIQNRLDVAEVLLTRGAEVNQPGWTALHYAATRGHHAMMRLLLEHNAYIDAEAPNGNTPLMMAAQFAPPLATKLLLEEGADPHLRNNLDRSALDLAQMRDNPQAAFYIRAFIEAWEVNERAQQEGAASQ